MASSDIAPGPALARAILGRDLIKGLSDEAIDGALIISQGTYVWCESSKGEIATKILTPTAVLAAFTDQPSDSGWLAPGVIRSGAGVNGTFAVLWIPPGEHALRFAKRVKGDPDQWRVRLPGLVFAGIGRQYYLWTTEGEQFSPDYVAAHAPLPNLHSNGHVCWGVNVPPLASAMSIGAAWALFITSEFNGDLVGNKSQVYRDDVRKALTRVRGTQRRSPQPYPLNDLVACNGKRIGTVIETTLFGGND